MAKEQSEIAKVEGMLGDAFGSLGGLEQTTQEENKEEIVEDSSEEVEAIAEVEEAVPSDGNVEENQDLEEEEITPPSGAKWPTIRASERASERASDVSTC